MSGPVKATEVLIDDKANPGQKYCEACKKSIEGSRASAHLVSKTHAEKFAKMIGAIPAATEQTRKTGKSGKKDAAPKDDVPEAKAERKKKAREDGPAEAKPAERKKKVRADEPTEAKPAERKKDGEKDAIKLPADPDIKGNVICGICRKSFLKSGTKAHLASAAHKKCADDELSAALQRTKL